MDRLAKSIRISCGIVLLANLAGWFLPWVSITQENYIDCFAMELYQRDVHRKRRCADDDGSKCL